MGAWGSLWVQFWATLSFQSVTDGPPEQFWDTAALKNQRFVQFVAHLGASGAHFGTIFGCLLLLEPLLSTIFGPPGHSLERSGHPRGVAGAPHEALQQHLGALACSKSGRKRAESNFGLLWDTPPAPLGAFLVRLYIKNHTFW